MQEKTDLLGTSRLESRRLVFMMPEKQMPLFCPLPWAYHKTKAGGTHKAPAIDNHQGTGILANLR